MTTDGVVSDRSGVAVLRDVLIAPGAAFETLRERPFWIVALVATCILGMTGAFLEVPALDRVAEFTITHSAKSASMTAEQMQQGVSIAQSVNKFTWLFLPLVIAIGFAIAGGIFTAAAALSKGRARFANLFALAANVGILTFGVSPLVLGLIVTIRGGAAFSTKADLLDAIPSLGWLVPASLERVHLFLDSFNVFQLWSIVLLALGLQTVGGVNRAPAWAVPIVVVAIGALLAAAGSR